MPEDSARGMLTRANEFIEAADIIIKHLLDKETPGAIQLGYLNNTPAYYLTAHGLELALKAFLRDHGVSAEELKNKLGHNLVKCLKKAEEKGVTSFPPDLKEVLPVVNDWYNGKELEYKGPDGMKDEVRLLNFYGWTAPFVNSIKLK